jgi:hypothetical protein
MVNFTLFMSLDEMFNEFERSRSIQLDASIDRITLEPIDPAPSVETNAFIS